jgi:predicted Zn-dependent protease
MLRAGTDRAAGRITVSGAMSIQAIRRRAARLAAATAIALTAAACTSMTSRQIFMPDVPKQTGAVAEVDREHERVLAAYGGAYDDPKMQAKLAGIVSRLVAASERPDLAYRITILNSQAVNAFALPNGQLYVTRGLLSLANDSSEVASVLSHEMAHVTARHAALREERAQTTDLLSGVNDLLGSPPSGAMALARSKLEAAGFSRAQEFEADGIGVATAARSGYDPFGAARLLTDMGRNADLRSSSRGQSPEFLSSHPATLERVKNAQTIARQYSAPGTGERDRADYLASLNGLVYGEDPVDGFVRAHRFLHPKLGFTFTAPDGFALDNTAHAVLGVKDGGAQALRLDVVKVPAEQTLAGYLASGWIENVDRNSVEELTINGFPAATATASGDQWAFRLYAIRFGSEVYRFIFASKNRNPESDRLFRETIQSFRRLTLAEIRSAKPLRVRVVKVGPRDSVETLATHMALIDRQVERFRTLNGLEAGEPVKTGEYVKIIVE